MLKYTVHLILFYLIVSIKTTDFKTPLFVYVIHTAIEVSLNKRIPHLAYMFVITSLVKAL